MAALLTGFDFMAMPITFPVGGRSTSDRMPTSLLRQVARTLEEQLIWQKLPRVLRCRLLIWIDCLYFPSEESATPHTVVWFVDQQTDRDWRLDWLMLEPDIDLLIAHLCTVVYLYCRLRETGHNFPKHLPRHFPQSQLCDKPV